MPQATPDSTSTSDVLTTVEPLSVSDLVGPLVDKLAGRVEGFELLQPNLVAALLIALAFVLLARSARSLVTTLMNKSSGRAAARPRVSSRYWAHSPIAPSSPRGSSSRSA